MFRHFPKLLWTIAAIFGLYLLVNGFASIKAPKASFHQNEEKCDDQKPSTNLSIKKLSRHFLDFNR